MISPMTRPQPLPANLLLGGLVLLPAALVGWAGVWVLGLSALLLVVVLLRRRLQFRGDWLAVLAASAALLGGVVGVSSAGSAIATVGSLPPYDTRLAFGWAALALAAVATACGLTRTQRVASSAAMVTAGLLGGAAISFFFINTAYWAAVPLWLLAAVLRLAGSERTLRKTTEDVRR